MRGKERLMIIDRLKMLFVILFTYLLSELEGILRNKGETSKKRYTFLEVCVIYYLAHFAHGHFLFCPECRIGQDKRHTGMSVSISLCFLTARMSGTLIIICRTYVRREL